MITTYRDPEGFDVTITVYVEPPDPSVGIFFTVYELESVGDTTDHSVWPEWALDLSRDHDRLERIVAEEINDSAISTRQADEWRAPC